MAFRKLKSVFTPTSGMCVCPSSLTTPLPAVTFFPFNVC